MFSGLIDEIKSSFGGGPTRKIVVAKPYCSPARDQITGALQPYGVKILGFHEYTKLDIFAGHKLPILQVAEVTVNAQAASWAEYLILRSGKFRVYGKYQDKRNKDWAARHAGKMPPAWKDGQPWMESSCSAGKEAWRNVKKGKGKK